MLPALVAPGPSRRWLAVFAALLTGAVLAGGALVYIGVDTLRGSRAGQSISAVSDPSAPGFEAFVEPSPTLLLVHRREGSVASIALLTLNAGDAGGAVVLVPPTTRTGPVPEALSVAATIAYLGDDGDAANLLQPLLGLGIAEQVVIDDDRWDELVAPVAPLSIDNPDDIEQFPQGAIELEADEVSTWLNPLHDGEDDLVRLFRHQLFWEAWAEAVAASSDPAAVPGELEVGLGRFVRGLGAGPVEVVTLPVLDSTGDDGTPRLDPDPVAVAALVNELVPFPTAARPGDRIRIRLVDGTGDPDHIVAVAPLVTRAGGQLVLAGNADRFDYDQTQVRYHQPEGRAAAEALAEALGAGSVIEDVRPIDAFDVTIVAGPDL